MTRTEIIELANQLTERKGERVLSLPTLYKFVLQDICKRHRFWWRRVRSSFTMTIGTASYALSDATIFASFANIALDEITKIVIVLASSPLQVSELTPIFDPEAVIEMDLSTQNVSPSRYTIASGGFQTLLIDPPDAAYTGYVIGWGMPNPPTDSSSDVVPLIPTWGHNTIVDGMRYKIFSQVYGDGHAKTVGAKKDYEQGIEDLAMRKQFDPSYVSQLSLKEGAVRST